MKMLSHAFLLSLSATLTLAATLAAPSVLAQQSPPGLQPAPGLQSPPSQPVFPPQGSLKLDRKPLPLQEGPGYFRTFPPARNIPGPGVRNRLRQAVAGSNLRLRLMSPDNMPCLVPNTARLEKMPVRPNASPSDHMPVDPGAARPAQGPRLRLQTNP
jgi:hypothetical protein